jgi:hypothetical protein
MTRLIQIVPREGVLLFSEMVGRVRERTQQSCGTFARSSTGEEAGARSVEVVPRQIQGVD